MKIVVLAGGTSTERDVSIVSGTGICQALRQKGHQAILVDVFCGLETVNWEDPFPAEYDVEKAAEVILSGIQQLLDNPTDIQKCAWNMYHIDPSSCLV